MGVSVILDLNEKVSLPELKHFLSYVPEGFDPTFDLRGVIENVGVPEFLLVQLPVPPQRD